MAASPVYTGRMRSALGIDGDGVVDMFKCLQLDIGAPPQFMDFRYVVHDEYHGGFILSHCGALMDVEPMGDEYVTSMSRHRGPTFDATAIATNRRARIRPVHRPPRVPTDRTPHCEWTVTIEPTATGCHCPSSQTGARDGGRDGGAEPDRPNRDRRASTTGVIWWKTWCSPTSPIRPWCAWPRRSRCSTTCWPSASGCRYFDATSPIATATARLPATSRPGGSPGPTHRDQWDGLGEVARRVAPW